MIYVLWIAATGEITICGNSGAIEDIEIPPGQQILAAATPVTPATHYVVAGALAEYTEQQSADKAQRPARGFAWSNATMAWVDARTLAEAKAQKRQELAGAWKSAMAAGVSVGGKVAPTDSAAWVDYLMLMLMAQESGWVDTPIELSDGMFELMTKVKAAALWDALKTLRRTQMAKLHEKVALVNLAATIEEVQAITWDMELPA